MQQNKCYTQRYHLRCHQTLSLDFLIHHLSQHFWRFLRTAQFYSRIAHIYYWWFHCTLTWELYKHHVAKKLPLFQQKEPMRQSCNYFHWRLIFHYLWKRIKCRTWWSRILGNSGGLTSWLLLVMFIVLLLLSHVVSWVRCGTWLYRFLIFAIFLTLLRMVVKFNFL